MKNLRVAVLGEGKSERLRKWRGNPHDPVPLVAQGAGEILVRRLLVGFGHVVELIEPAKAPPHKGRGVLDEASAIRDAEALRAIAVGTLSPVGPARDSRAHLLVVLSDAIPQHQLNRVSEAIHAARRSLVACRDAQLILLVADPEFEAVVGQDKEAVEKALNIQPCRYSPPEVGSREAFRAACASAGTTKVPDASDLARIAEKLDVTKVEKSTWADPLVQNWRV